MAHVENHTNGDGLIVREDERDPSALPTFLYGFTGIIVLLVLIFAAEALYYRAQKQDDVAKVELRDVPGYGDMKTSQLARLGGYNLLDPERGLVSIPIDKAIERTVADLKAGRPLPIIQQTAPAPDDAPAAKPPDTAPEAGGTE